MSSCTSGIITRVDRDRLFVTFTSHGMDTYKTFLACKKLPEYRVHLDEDTDQFTIETSVRFADMLGVEASPPRLDGLELPSFLYDDQAYLVKHTLQAKRFAVWSGCGNGKGFTPDTPVLVPGAWKPIGQLAEGDLVIGRDGKPYPVTGVYHRGEQPLYRVTFSDGTSVVCDEDHLWNVKSPHDLSFGRDWRTMSVRQLIASNIRYGANGRSRKWQIPMCDAVQHPKAQLPLHPYILGVLLGDGALSRGGVTWCKPDEFIAERVAGLLPAGSELRVSDSEDRAKVWRITGLGPNLPNPVLIALRQLGLMGKLSHQKSVPSQYLFTCIEDRISLLQGLLDTDGYLNGHSPEFCSTSEDLADAVVWLTQSLGGTSSKYLRSTPNYTHNGERREGRPAWRVSLQLPKGIEPFSLPRKAQGYSPATRGFGRWIDSIEPVGDGQSVCISVDSPDRLFVVQHHIVTHNTIIGLEYARQVTHTTGGRVLIVTVNDVVDEWIKEAHKFYPGQLTLERIASRKALREWASRTGSAIGIVNYEKFNPDDSPVVHECKRLAGVVLDEAGRLRASAGKQKWDIIKSFKGVEYKLALTATPAPNEVMEFASQASFLEMLRTESEILWTYFTRGNTKGKGQGKWTVKPHAREAFYRFMSSWSIYINDPKRYGWRKDVPDVPKHEHIRHDLEPTVEQLDAARSVRELAGRKVGLVEDSEPSLVERNHLSQIAKGFLYTGKPSSKKREYDRIPSAKPAFVADLVRQELQEPDGRVIVWTEYDAEADILREHLAGIEGVAVLTGAVKKSDRAGMLDRFRHGDIRVLVTRAKLVGYGVNLQQCTGMIFSGWDDGFEKVYQAIRRAVRHGQTKAVKVHFPVVRTLEEHTYNNIRRKEHEFEASIAEMETHYLRQKGIVS